MADTTNQNQGDKFEKLTPILEYTYIVLYNMLNTTRSMKNYVEAYARDMKLTDLEQFGNAVRAIDSAIEGLMKSAKEVGAIYGLPEDMLDPQKMAQELAKKMQEMQANGQLPQDMGSVESAPSAPAVSAPTAPAESASPSVEPAPVEQPVQQEQPEQPVPATPSVPEVTPNNASTENVSLETSQVPQASQNVQATSAQNVSEPSVNSQAPAPRIEVTGTPQAGSAPAPSDSSNPSTDTANANTDASNSADNGDDNEDNEIKNILEQLKALRNKN